MTRTRKTHRHGPFVLIALTCALSLGLATSEANDRPARVREATDRASPSVVSIRPAGIAVAPIPPPFIPPFGRFGRPPYRIPGPVIEEQRAAGSGVIVDAKRGLILTNASVARGAARVRITFFDGAVRESRRVALQGARDGLALIEFDPQGAELVQAEWGDSDSLRLGDDVLAVGRSERGDLLASAGIVASERRKTDADSSLAPILTDALIAAETVGGPLLDLNGRVVGICQLSSATWDGGPRSDFHSATPANQAKAAVEELADGGPRPRGYLGVMLGDVAGDPGRAEGVLVTGVAPGSPAAEAGIEPGDRILSVDGRLIADAQSLSKAVEGAPVGGELTLGIDRRGAEIEIKARTRAKALQPPAPMSRPPIRSEPSLRLDDGDSSEVESEF